MWRFAVFYLRKLKGNREQRTQEKLGEHNTWQVKRLKKRNQDLASCR